jgi:hypothetical protein
MQQRYDLLAFSLLLLSVLISVMPINMDGINKWQPLIGGVIGGTITVVGVLVASYNVTRQMRLTARGREQDRLERELPGLRAATFLLGRISIAIGNTPNAGKILKELKARGFDEVTFADFTQQVIDSLPMTIDFTRREMAVELFKLRAMASRVVQKEEELSRTKGHYEYVLKLVEPSPGQREQAADNLAMERETLTTMFEQLVKAFHEFDAYRERLVQRGTAEAKRYDALRREHERSLKLRS